MKVLLWLAVFQVDRPAPTEETIRGWIAVLGHDDIDRRSEASRKLLEIGEPILPYLSLAWTTSDPEVRARCQALITALTPKPTIWETGARDAAKVGVEVPAMMIDPGQKKEYEALLGAGKVTEILTRDSHWLTYAFDGILSDQKAVAEGSFLVIHKIIQKRALPARMSDLATQPTLTGSSSAELRAAEYTYWAQWWLMAASRELIASWKEEPGESTDD